MCPHSPVRERVAKILDVRGEATAEDSSTREESKLQRSWWGSHLSDLGHQKI